MTSSLTTALEELRRENDVLKTDNATMKDEVGQLSALLNEMDVKNENQMQQIISQSSEIATMKDEIKQLKVSQWSGITKILNLVQLPTH